jgi:hypothetical protein
MPPAGNRRSRRRRRSTCPSHRRRRRARIWRRPYRRLTWPPNQPRTPYGGAPFFGRLAASPSLLRVCGACAESDRACGPAGRPGTRLRERRSRGSSVPAWPMMRPAPIARLGSGPGAQVSARCRPYASANRPFVPKSPRSNGTSMLERSHPGTALRYSRPPRPLAHRTLRRMPAAALVRCRCSIPRAIRRFESRVSSRP